MKRIIGIMITAIAMAWPMSGAAFDFGDMLESGAGLIEKGSEMMDKTSSSRSSKNAEKTHLELAMYPKAFQWEDGVRNQNCSTWLAYGSQKKVADFFTKALKKDGHSVERHIADLSGAYAGRTHNVTVLTINEKHWCGKTSSVSTYHPGQLENCRKMLNVWEICAKSPKSKSCKQAKGNVSVQDELQSESNPYFRNSIDAEINLDSIQTKKGDEFFKGLRREVSYRRHSMAEYNAMKKKYGYLTSMYYIDGVEEKLLREYHARTTEGQVKNLQDNHPDSPAAGDFMTGFKTKGKEMQDEGASQEEMMAAMMQFQMQNQAGGLAAGRQGKAAQDIGETDYWDDWVEFLKKLAKKATYATKITSNPRGQDGRADGTLSIRGVSSCQRFGFGG